jgi:hypothetical protein
MKNIFLLVLLMLLAFTGMFLVSGCTPKADLIPVNPEGWAGFCDLVDSAASSYYGSDLRVHIKNQGEAPAGNSYVLVDWGFANTIEPVPAIPAGNTVSVLIEVPQGCFNPDCGFTIIVDYNEDVNESNEANNSQIGNCIG